MVTIAWLGLLDSDEATGSTRAEDHLALLAMQVVAASARSWSIELISCGRQSGKRSIGAGVDRVVLPLAGAPRTPWDRVSWELPDALAAADLVHLHDGFSRSCELALLIAKQLRKPVCTTEWGIDGHGLSAELSLRELADVIICHDAAAAEAISSTKPVELVACDVDIRRLGAPAPWPANHCLDFDDRDITARARKHDAPPVAGAEAGRGDVSAGNRPHRPGDAPVAAPPGHRLGSAPATGPHEQYAAAGARLAEIYRRLIAGARRAAA